ncbi:acid phosphatase-domain-containing protein [Mycena latifolia]|nr:acid phosphatase-domain-containing protein [Mycena latifolia]
MVLPKLVAFDLNNTIWTRSRCGNLFLNPDIWRIMKFLERNGVKIAICSKHTSKQEAQDFFKQTWTTFNGAPRNLMSFVARGCFVVQKGKCHKKSHFKIVKQQSRIDYDDMLFFDDNTDNNTVTEWGITFQEVNSRGFDWATFQEGLDAYDDAKSSPSTSPSPSPSLLLRPPPPPSLLFRSLPPPSVPLRPPPPPSLSLRPPPAPSVALRPPPPPMPFDAQAALDARYRNFTRKLVNITTGDWSIYPESIRNTHKGDILWTDGSANHAFASAPTITAYKVVRRRGNVWNGSVMMEGLASASPYYFQLQ